MWSAESVESLSWNSFLDALFQKLVLMDRSCRATAWLGTATYGRWQGNRATPWKNEHGHQTFLILIVEAEKKIQE